MNQSETTTQAGIEETIGQVEKLYHALTGAAAPTSDGPYAPIPAEKDPVQHVEEQLSRLIDLLGQAAPVAALKVAWMPPMTIFDTDGEIFICLDLPGLKREQVEVEMQGDTITVSGVRPIRQGVRLRSNESAIGPFRRTLMIPAAMRGTEPSAQMKDGVLEIRIQKPPAEATNSRPVPVH